MVNNIIDIVGMKYILISREKSMDITKVKIIADSSADVMHLEGVPFSVAPLKIITDEKEYIDDQNLNVIKMAEELSVYSGKSSSACPSPADWLNNFGDAEFVFCVTITSNLSGSYNSAIIAKQDYEEKYPDRKVFVIDSLSTGPELTLIIEKLRDLILAGESYDKVCKQIADYQSKTALVFMLESMRNLANNGRVHPFVAKAAGILGIRLVGKASDVGTLEPLEKCRGERKALSTLVSTMRKLGTTGGEVRIGHCNNEAAANALKELLQKEFRNINIKIYSLRGLCSFYAEKGGLLVGFEKAPVFK